MDRSRRWPPGLPAAASRWMACRTNLYGQARVVLQRRGRVGRAWGWWLQRRQRLGDGLNDPVSRGPALQPSPGAHAQRPCAGAGWPGPGYAPVPLLDAGSREREASKARVVLGLVDGLRRRRRAPASPPALARLLRPAGQLGERRQGSFRRAHDPEAIERRDPGPTLGQIGCAAPTRAQPWFARRRPQAGGPGAPGRFVPPRSPQAAGEGVPLFIPQQRIFITFWGNSFSASARHEHRHRKRAPAPRRRAPRTPCAWRFPPGGTDSSVRRRARTSRTSPSEIGPTGPMARARQQGEDPGGFPQCREASAVKGSSHCPPGGARRQRFESVQQRQGEIAQRGQVLRAAAAPSVPWLRHPRTPASVVRRLAPCAPPACAPIAGARRSRPRP